MPPSFGARGEPAQHRVGALAVEAEPIDHAFVARQPKHARARIAGLRLRRHGADLDEAETELEQRVGHLGVLVEARRHPDRVGEIEPEGPHRQPRVVRHQLDERRDLQRQDGEPVRILGVEQAQQRPRELLEQADHGAKLREQVAPAGTERQRLRPQHRGERQRAVEMRKQVAAAGRLPSQRAGQRIGIDRHQHQVAGTGEMLGGGLGHLPGGRKMDEAVALVDRRRRGTRRHARPRAKGSLADLVDGRHGWALAAGGRRFCSRMSGIDQ